MSRDHRDAPEEAHNEHFLVGHSADVADAILRFLEAPGIQHRMRARGPWGIGKTLLVSTVARQAKDRAVVLPIFADRYVPGGAPSQAKDLETVHYVRNWGKFTELLRDLVSQVEGDRGLPRGFGELREQIAWRQNDVPNWVLSPDKIDFRPEFKGRGAIEAENVGSLFYQAPSEPVLTIEAKIESAVAELTAKFQRELDIVAGASGAVLLVDEFHRLSGHLIAGWLLRLVTGSRRAVVLLATRVVSDEFGEYEDAIDADEELTPFSDSDARLYLGRRLGDQLVSDELVARVVGFSDRLPQGVAMAADLIEQRVRTGRPPTLEDVAHDDELPGAAKLLLAIMRDLAALGDEDTLMVLKEGRLARRIDLELVHYLLTRTRYEDGSDESRKRAGRTWARLQRYSFVEEPEALGDDGLARHRLHEYIRRARLPSDELPDELYVDDEAVNAALMRYYERRLDEYDESRAEQSAYMQWYKYEQREWQALTSEWLYHSGRLRREEARAAARLELARVFLEAFWWWGCYVPFDFCERMLEDWEATQPEPDRQWSGYLRQILRDYPRGPWKTDQGDWEAVERTLHRLRKDARITGQLSTTPSVDADKCKQIANQRAVRALTSILLAHAVRFRSGCADLALPLYEDALTHLPEGDDAAVIAWTTFELAELWLELGNATKSAATLRDATATLLDSCAEDLELLANLHRLRADLAARQDPTEDLVLAETARAVLRAYAFQIEPSGAPDDYTVAFYEEMRERACARVTTIREAAGDEAAVAAAVRLRALLEPIAGPFELRVDPGAVRAAFDDPAALKALLMPPPPPLGEAGLHDSRFATTARRTAMRIVGDPSDRALATAVP